MNDEIYEKIEKAIYEKGKYKDFNISYAMNEDLDALFTEGKIRIEYVHLHTDILINPTYLDIVVAVNDLMNIEDFGDHRFLEDIFFERNDDDVKIYSLHFGS
jgi:hypothetical protein